MNSFRINDSLTAICEWKKTRNAFKHEATLLRDGLEQNTVKICYQNRTWEAYEFQSVLSKLAEDKDSELSAEEAELFKNRIKGQFREDDERETAQKFGAIGAIAKLGELFSDSKAGANDWKARMLKAGLNIEMPSNWDTLSEEEQGRRLDAVIGELTK